MAFPACRLPFRYWLVSRLPLKSAHKPLFFQNSERTQQDTARQVSTCINILTQGFWQSNRQMMCLTFAKLSKQQGVSLLHSYSVSLLQTNNIMLAIETPCIFFIFPFHSNPDIWYVSCCDNPWMKECRQREKNLCTIFCHNMLAIVLK